MPRWRQIHRCLKLVSARLARPEIPHNTIVLCGISGRARRADTNLRHRCIWRHRGIAMRDEAPPQADKSCGVARSEAKRRRLSRSIKARIRRLPSDCAVSYPAGLVIAAESEPSTGTKLDIAATDHIRPIVTTTVIPS